MVPKEPETYYLGGMHCLGCTDANMSRLVSQEVESESTDGKDPSTVPRGTLDGGFVNPRMGWR